MAIIEPVSRRADEHRPVVCVSGLRDCGGIATKEVVHSSFFCCISVCGFDVEDKIEEEDDEGGKREGVHCCG